MTRLGLLVVVAGVIWRISSSALLPKERANWPRIYIESVARSRTCEPKDIDCLNLKAVELTNEIRARNGVNTKLVAGPKPMLSNAKKWSKHQMGAGMQHQSPLPSLDCGIKVNRENVAWFGGMDSDPAEQCMKQWEDSPGHKANIMAAEAGDYVSIGIDIEDDKVYCTQTFASPASYEGGDESCAPVYEGDSQDEEPSKDDESNDTNEKSPGENDTSPDNPNAYRTDGKENPDKNVTTDSQATTRPPVGDNPPTNGSVPPSLTESPQFTDSDSPSTGDGYPAGDGPPSMGEGSPSNSSSPLPTGSNPPPTGSPSKRGGSPADGDDPPVMGDSSPSNASSPLPTGGNPPPTGAVKQDKPSATGKGLRSKPGGSQADDSDPPSMGGGASLNASSPMEAGSRPPPTGGAKNGNPSSMGGDSPSRRGGYPTGRGGPQSIGGDNPSKASSPPSNGSLSPPTGAEKEEDKPSSMGGKYPNKRGGSPGDSQGTTLEGKSPSKEKSSPSKREGSGPGGSNKSATPSMSGGSPRKGWLSPDTGPTPQAIGGAHPTKRGGLKQNFEGPIRSKAGRKPTRDWHNISRRGRGHRKGNYPEMRARHPYMGRRSPRMRAKGRSEQTAQSQLPTKNSPSMSSRGRDPLKGGRHNHEPSRRRQYPAMGTRRPYFRGRGHRKGNYPEMGARPPYMGRRSPRMRAKGRSEQTAQGQFPTKNSPSMSYRGRDPLKGGGRHNHEPSRRRQYPAMGTRSNFGGHYPSKYRGSYPGSGGFPVKKRTSIPSRGEQAKASIPQPNGMSMGGRQPFKSSQEASPPGNKPSNGHKHSATGDHSPMRSHSPYTHGGPSSGSGRSQHSQKPSTPSSGTVEGSKPGRNTIETVTTTNAPRITFETYPKSSLLRRNSSPMQSSPKKPA